MGKVSVKQITPVLDLRQVRLDLSTGIYLVHTAQGLRMKVTVGPILIGPEASKMPLPWGGLKVVSHIQYPRALCHWLPGW